MSGSWIEKQWAETDPRPRGELLSEIEQLRRERDELTVKLAFAENGQRIDNINSNGFYQKWKAAEAEVAKLREALEFYADLKRYEGANQRPEAGDKYTPRGFPYRVDVTRDLGDIARAALAQPKEGQADGAS